MLFRCAWEVKADPEQPPTPTAPEHAQCGFLVLVFRPWPFRSPSTGSQLRLPARDLPREPGLLSPPRCRHPLVLLLVRELGGGGGDLRAHLPRRIEELARGVGAFMVTALNSSDLFLFSELAIHVTT